MSFKVPCKLNYILIVLNKRFNLHGHAWVGRSAEAEAAEKKPPTPASAGVGNRHDTLTTSLA